MSRAELEWDVLFSADNFVGRSMKHGETAERSGEEGRRFAQRVYLPRMLGAALGVACVGGGLWQEGAAPWVWVLLLLNAAAWPRLAYGLAMRSDDPYRAEQRNLVVDSATGGVWIAAMGFNLVPSVVLIAMLAMDKAAIGGARLLARCLAAQAVAALTVAVVAGIDLAVIESSLVAQIASLPMLIAYPVAVGTSVYRLTRRVAALSTIDGLTQILNREHWERAAELEVHRCRRMGHSAALMMIDIDHFKAINDSHGHAAGDAAIRAVADILRDSLRKNDVPGRYGGEEFGVVLPGIGAAGAAATAERIRKRIESAVLESHHGVRATASIGFAALDRADADASAWIGRADRALYRAKQAGRNRCIDDNLVPQEA
jgi:diguanylate cyclase